MNSTGRASWMGRAGLATLVIGLAFVACARVPQPSGSAGTGTNPYAGGVSYPWADRIDPGYAGHDYSWVGVHGSGAMGTQASTDNYLSDLTWTTATNAWGSAEKDRSNGEQATGDGKPLTIGGQVFQKGLGVHASSELVYSLGGSCSTFSAQVGIDDEVGNQGSVVFQLWNGTTKLYDSGVLRGSDTAKAMSVDITGVQNLRLVVTNGGDTIDYDHADWGDAKVSCQSTTPGEGVVQVSTLGWQNASNGWGPIERDQSNGEQGQNDGKPLTIGGVVYPKGLGVHAASEVSFALGANCSTFSAQVGIDDEVGNQGSVAFQLWSGTTKLYDSGVLRGSDTAKAVNVDVTGVQTLRLVVTNGGDTIDYDHADWGDAKVSCRVTPGSSATTIDYQAVAAQPYGVAEAQGLSIGGQLYVFGGFDILKGFTPTDRAYRYDPARNTWTALATMPTRGVTHAGFTTDGTSIYYAGGYIADSSGNGQVFGTRAVWRYDVAGNSYSRLPDLPTECAAGQLQVLDGKLHYFGGLDASRTRDIAAHYVLNLTAGATAWTVAAPLPLPRNHLGSAVLGGRIYAVGGQTGSDGLLVARSDVFAYDPGQDQWMALKSLPFGRGHIAGSTFVIGGRIVVAGGETAHTVPTSDVSAYDPATNTWATLTPLPQARSSAVAGAIDAQHLVFTAGNNASGQPQAGGWQGTLR